MDPLNSVVPRLTLAYTLILSFCLLAGGAILYFHLKGLFFNLAFELPSARAVEIQQLVAGVSPPSHPGENEALGLTSSALVVAPGNGLTIQVLDRSGRMVNRSTDLPAGKGLPVPTAPALAQRGVRQSGGKSWAWVSLPLIRGGRLLGSVQAAAPLQPTLSLLSVVKRALILSFVVGVGVSAFLGWVLATLAFRPVRQMVRELDGIGPVDLERRLGGASRRDEFGRLGRAFNKMLDRLAAGAAAQRAFVATASHQLRTPLAVLRGYADVLTRWEEEPDLAREALTGIRASLGKMERLLRQMLILAREEEKTVSPLAPVSLRGEVEEATADMRLLHPEIRVRLEMGELTVLADAEKLRQVLVILLDNAFSHTPPGGEVLVMTERGRESVELAVSDTGSGIPPADLPYIFERFYRGGGGFRSKGAEGFGLGLSIARLYVTKMGGTITASNRVEGGAVFTVGLRLAV